MRYAPCAEEVTAASLPEGHPTWGIIETTLASVAYAARHDLEAVERYERVLGLLPPDDESRLPSHSNLVGLHENLGDLATAERHARAAVDFADRLVDPRYAQRESAHGHLARMLLGRGDLEGAARALDRALAVDAERLPGYRSRRHELLATRAQLDARLGDVGRAVEAAEEALRLALQGTGVTPRETMRMRSTLGAAYLAAERVSDAVAVLETAVAEALDQGLLRTELGAPSAAASSKHSPPRPNTAPPRRRPRL